MRGPSSRGLRLLTVVGVIAAGMVAAPSSAAQDSAAGVIVVGEDAPDLERLASKEVQRYLYHLTGDKLEIHTDAEIDEGSAGPMVVVGRRDTNAVIADMSDSGLLPTEQEAPGSEGYVIRTVAYDGREAIAVMGSGASGSLYGAYELLERYGARFYIGRDVFPETKRPFTVKQLDVAEEPAHERRGLLPWHDFLNGPSGYSYEDFKQYLDQMAKMKMNTLMLHNYSGSAAHVNQVEPFMDFACNGVDQTDGYLDTSIDSRWALAPSPADKLAFHSGDYLPYDILGSDAARYTREQPDAQKYIFAKAQAMMQKVIRYAQSRGMEIVLGTELDVIPGSQRGACDPLDPGVLKARIDAILEIYPSLKYIQMYFSEANQLSTADAIEAYRVMRDHLAQERPEARLLTGSWFQEERFPQMDEALPEDIVFSTLLPHDMRVKPQWAGLNAERETWAVPWVEFDGALSEPQLAVQRMEEQLPKLRAAGVDGLMGILWRERPVEANVAYLAQAAWQPANEVISAEQFYRDYARANFGDAAAEAGAEALAALENAGVYGRSTWSTPEYARWWFCGDPPAGLDRCPEAEQYAAKYRALGQRFRALEPLVGDPAQRQDLEYWIQFMRWLDAYWRAHEQVPTAAASIPRSSNYFLVDAGGRGEKDLLADYGYYAEGGGATHPGHYRPVEDDFGYPTAMRSERWSSSPWGYRFDVPEGYDRYRVELYFQESWFGVLAPGDPVGKRVFDIEINDSLVQDDFDPAAAAGRSAKSVRLVFDVPITNGALDITFVPVVSNPKVDVVRAYPIDVDGEPLPRTYPPEAEKAWEELKGSGIREAIDAYQKTVRDQPGLGGLVSASGGRWYFGPGSLCGSDFGFDEKEIASFSCSAAQASYRTYQNQVVAQLGVAPPDNVVVRGTSTGAVVTWRPYEGRADEVVGYRVYRRPVSGGGFARLTADPVTATSYEDSTDGEFVYAVTAVDGDGGESPRSYEEWVQAGGADDIAPRVLRIPRNLEAVRGEPLRVTALVVDGRVPAEVSATVHYRVLGEGAWKTVGMRRNSLARPYTFFADIPAREVGKETVEYYISATDGTNTSYAPAGAPQLTASALAVARGPEIPGTVPELAASWQADRGAVMLSWQPAPAALAHQYNIYRSTTPGFTPSRATYVTYVPSQQRVFLDVNVKPGTTYYYRIEPETIEERTGPATREVSVAAPPR